MAERRPVSVGDEISFTVASDSVVAARSASAPSVTHRQFLATIGKDSLFLYTTIEENTDQPFQESSGSRAASKTTGNLDAFYLDAFYNGNTPFMNGTHVEWKEGGWKYSPLKYWPNNEEDWLDFYGYASDAFTWKTKHESFSYTLPSAAANQQDLIFAQALHQSKQTVNGKVMLNFYHALSAVLFKVGSLPDDITLDNLKITLAGVKNGGTCAITNNNNALSFAWDTDDASTSSYSQSFSSDGYAYGDDISTIDSEQAFMMVPHTFEDEAELQISFKVGDVVTHEFNHPLSIEAVKDGDKWMPNTKYTYTISIEEFVEVEVEEDFEQGSNVKENVRFQNTGLSDVKMRAAIVGYWVVNEEEDIILPWDINNEEQGTIDWGIGWTKNDGDGFYYYDKVVEPGAFTENLFDKYQLKQNPPVMGAKLMLDVVVQAVAVEVFNSENAPWGL